MHTTKYYYIYSYIPLFKKILLYALICNYCTITFNDDIILHIKCI